MKRFFLLLVRIISLAAIALPLSTFAVTQGGAARMFLSPSTATIGVGDTTNIDVRFDTGGSAILSGEAYISFDPNVLEASVSTEGTNFSLVAEKTIDATAGTIRIISGTPAPGYTGNNGKIATITFTGKAAGSSTVTLGETSKLSLLNGESVVDVLGTVSGATISVSGGGSGGGDTTPPQITSPTATGVQKTSAKIVWTTNESTTGKVEYGTSTQFGSTVEVTTSATNHTITLTNLTPGTVYAYRIHATDASGNESISQALTFTTQKDATTGGDTNNTNNTSTPTGGSTQKNTQQNSPQITAPITGAGETIAIVVAIIAGLVAVGLYIAHIRKKTL